MSPKVDGSLLVAESRFASHELAGLDEIVEIFAIDQPSRQQPAEQAAAEWGDFWQDDLLEGAALPVERLSTSIPEEGGLLLRPLRPAASMDLLSWEADSNRHIQIPRRDCHRDAELPAPSFVSNDLFIELRYSLPPSLIVHFDFSDLALGVFRAFAIPLKEGEATLRLLLVVDPLAVVTTLNAAAGTSTAALRWRPCAERMERFLAAAAGAPPSSCWYSTVERGSGLERDGAAGTVAGSSADGLFPHQSGSVAWMAAIESADALGHIIDVQPIELCGRQFGAPYQVHLPLGGVIGHPPGAGKTRIASTLIALRAGQDTLVLCPGHLLAHWADELCAAIGSAGAPIEVKGTSGGAAMLAGYVWASHARSSGHAAVIVLGFHALEAASDQDMASNDTTEAAPAIDDEPANGTADKVAPTLDYTIYRIFGWRLRAERLLIDEPQDADPEMYARIAELAPRFIVRWLVCGTAAAHVRTLGPLLLGPKRWRAATTVDEWRAKPTLSHVYRHRFVRDPAWACLPRPPLSVHKESVTPSQEEAVAAQMAALSGYAPSSSSFLTSLVHPAHPASYCMAPCGRYVVDSVLLLSFGQHATALAVRERQQHARDTRLARRRLARQRARQHTPHEDPIPRLPVDDTAPTVAAAAPAEATPLAAAEVAAIEDDDDDSSDTDDDETGDGVEGLGLVVTTGGGGALPLSEWTTVESQCRHRLSRVEGRLRKLRARLEQQASAFVLSEGRAAGDGVLQRLAFLQADALTLAWHVGVGAAWDAAAADGEAAAEGGIGWETVPTQSLASAEWNALLDAAGGESIVGYVARLASAQATAAAVAPITVSHEEGGTPPTAAHEALRARGGVLVAMEGEIGGDFCAAAWAAHGLGAAALLVACDGEVTRPMAFGSDQLAPPIPACMLPRKAAEALLDASDGALGATARLTVLPVAFIEEDAAGGGGGVDEGLMADVVALDDAVSQKEHGKFVALQAERERLAASLRFASRVQQQLTLQKEREMCPVCLEPQVGAVCVLPECFHCLCRACLQKASGGHAAFRCPLCRVRVLTWTVTAFHTAAERFDAASTPPAGVAMPPPLWRRLPTKLQHLVTLVHTLLKSGPDEHILIYTQWLAHVEHLGETLASASVRSLRMSGDLTHCMHCLSQFGRVKGAPRVLLLSSQHHASGINLQVARHLIIVHPYCTPTACDPEDVDFMALNAFEQQAIGRIRRYPQTETVQVYRLFAAESVEEGLYNGGYTHGAKS